VLSTSVSSQTGLGINPLFSIIERRRHLELRPLYIWYQ
jgi:hypothetical protein